MSRPNKILGLIFTISLLFILPIKDGAPISTIKELFDNIVTDEWKMWFAVCFMFYGVLALLFPEDR